MRIDLLNIQCIDFNVYINFSVTDLTSLVLYANAMSWKYFPLKSHLRMVILD
jgi:hypothetical protein